MRVLNDKELDLYDRIDFFVAATLEFVKNPVMFVGNQTIRREPFQRSFEIEDTIILRSLLCDDEISKQGFNKLKERESVVDLTKRTLFVINVARTLLKYLNERLVKEERCSLWKSYTDNDKHINAAQERLREILYHKHVMPILTVFIEQSLLKEPGLHALAAKSPQRS